MKESIDIQLSIIVPVYNVEEYIRPCIESIFRQNLDEECFEVIIVNDGTEDRSMEIIQDIIEQHKNITVINQENQGLSVARNNGISMAKGEYILMPDSDDLLIENSLPALLDKALETKADLIVADFLKMNDEEIVQLDSKYPPQEKFIIKEKSGQDLFLEDLNPHQCYVWRTLFRKDFILRNHISFVPGIYYQDVPFTHECYLKANRCIRTIWLLYIYRTRRLGSATASFSSQKARSFIIAISNTWKLRQIQGLSSTVRNKIEEDVYTSFSMMVYSTLHSIKRLSERNSIMDFLNTEVPDLNFTHGIKQRLISIMIKKMPHIFINLYYLYAQIIYK